MSNFIYSINATLPIFLLIILGKVLKTTKIINDEFTKTADRYVFRIALPALLFSDLTENNVGSAFDGKYVLFCFSVTIFSIAVLWGLTEKFMKNEEQKGFPASVYEVVLSGRLNGRGWKPFYRKEDKEAAAEKMEMLGITDLARQCFRDLSGGQQQRALLARALCATKSLLLLDEPVTGLDPIVTGEFYDLIRKINQESNIAVVMVSHDIETAVENASHILHLQETVRFFGTAEDYRKSRIGKKFLGGEEHD